MYKKKLILIMLLVLISSTSYANPSDWAEDTVSKVQERGALEDRAFGDFQDNITRKDFAYLGVRLYEILTGSSTSVGNASFTDTNDEFVLKAKNAGFIDGVGEGLFEPSREITRDEIAALFVKLYNATGVDYKSGDTAQEFADKNEIASWAQDFVKIARANEIVNGVGNNKFAPKDKASREVALIMFDRTLEQFEGTLDGVVKDDTIVGSWEDEEEVAKSVWDANYGGGQDAKNANPNSFEDWQLAGEIWSPFFNYATKEKGLETDLMYSLGEGALPENYPTAVSGVAVNLWTLEEYEDLVENIFAKKEWNRPTATDWNRVYQVITQDYAYENFSREHFDILKNDLLSMMESPRQPIEGVDDESWFGLIDNKYSLGVYLFPNDLVAYIVTGDYMTSFVISTRDNNPKDRFGITFEENLKMANDYPDIYKLVDLR